MFRNHEGYYDPVAGLALSHIMREERQKRKRSPKRYLRDKIRSDDHRCELQKRLFNQIDTRMLLGCPASISLRLHEIACGLMKIAKQEVAETKMASRMYTRNVMGETEPYQALADAIIIRAIKDYRRMILMMNRLKRRMRGNKKLSCDERDYLALRYERYERLLDDAGDFFFSDLFAVLCDLDGYELLDRLNRELMK